MDAGTAKVTLSIDGAEKAVRGLQRKLAGIGAGLGRLGKTGLAAGVGIAAAFAPAVQVFAGFDDQMRQVRAVSGATAAEFAELTEEAKELGRTTSFSASQVAGMMAELGRAGFNASQIKAASADVLSFAAATGTELPRAAEIAGAALRGFNLEADEMGRVADVLTATANGTAQTTEDLFEALKPVAPIAAAAGESIEETTALIGVMANNGIKGSLAGNALARAFKNLATESKQNALAQMGVDAVDAAGNLRPMIDILTDLDAATAEFGEAQRLATFETLFGRGQAAALKLAEATRGGFAAVADGINNSAGIAARTAAEMEGGIGGTFRKLWSAVEGVAIAVGEALVPVLTSLSNKAMELLGPLTEWISKNGELVAGVAAAAAGLAAAGAAAIALGAVISGLSAIIGAVTAVFGALSAVAGAVATAVGTVGAPVLLTAAAIAAVVEIVGRLLGFESPIGSLFSALGQGAAWAAGQLRGLLGSALDWLTEKVQSFFKWIGLASEEVGTIAADAPEVAAATAVPDQPPPAIVEAQRRAAAGLRVSQQNAAAGGPINEATLVRLMAPLLAAQERIVEATEATASNTANLSRLRGLAMGA